MALSRITVQGEANLVRNRGTMGPIFNMDDNVSTGYMSARPCSRVTEAAHSNKLQAHGTMDKYLDVNRNIQQGFDTSPCGRVTMQAEPNYIKGQGTMGRFLNRDENLRQGYMTARAAPRACPTVESQIMKDRSKGSMSDYIGTGSEYQPPPIERKIHPRAVPDRAARTAEVSKGKRMEMIIHEANNMPVSPKPCGRVVKPEAEDIAHKHEGRPVAILINNYGTLPMSVRAPRVTVWGADNQQLDQGGRMKTLIDDQQKMPCPQQRPPSAPVKTTSANYNLISDRVYGNKMDNYNKRNATQWDQSWKM